MVPEVARPVTADSGLGADLWLQLRLTKPSSVGARPPRGWAGVAGIALLSTLALVLQRPSSFCLHTRTRTHTHTFVHTCVHTRACTRTHRDLHKLVCTHVLHTLRARAHVHTQTPTHLRAHTHTCTDTCTLPCAHTQDTYEPLPARMCCKHIHIGAHTDAFTTSCVHTCTPTCDAHPRLHTHTCTQARTHQPRAPYTLSAAGGSACQAEIATTPPVSSNLVVLVC